MGVDTLPEGFVIDQPSGNSSSQLPEGFVVDSPTATQESPIPRKPFVQDVRERILQSLKDEPMNKYQELMGFVKGFTGSDPIKAINIMSNNVAAIKEDIQATINGVKFDTEKQKGLQIPEQDQTGVTAERVGNAAAIAAIAYTGAKALKAGADKIDLERGYKKVAVEAKRELNAVYNEFNQKYDSIIKPVATNPAYTTPVQSQIIAAADAVPEGSVAEKYMGKLIDRLDNTTVEQLHSLKAEVFKTAKNMVPAEKSALMNVYDSINKTLSLPQNAGPAYQAVTSEYSSFINNEQKYVASKILDRFGQITESKLSGGSKLTMNDKNAFETLSSRKTSGVDLLKELKSLDRVRSAIKASRYIGGKAIVGAATAAGASAVAAPIYGAYQALKR